MVMQHAVPALACEIAVHGPPHLSASHSTLTIDGNSAADMLHSLRLPRAGLAGKAEKLVRPRLSLCSSLRRCADGAEDAVRVVLARICRHPSGPQPGVKLGRRVASAWKMAKGRGGR